MREADESKMWHVVRAGLIIGLSSKERKSDFLSDKPTPECELTARLLCSFISETLKL